MNAWPRPRVRGEFSPTSPDAPKPWTRGCRVGDIGQEDDFQIARPCHATWHELSRAQDQGLRVLVGIPDELATTGPGPIVTPHSWTCLISIRPQLCGIPGQAWCSLAIELQARSGDQESVTSRQHSSALEGHAGLRRRHGCPGCSMLHASELAPAARSQARRAWPEAVLGHQRSAPSSSYLLTHPSQSGIVDHARFWETGGQEGGKARWPMEDDAWYSRRLRMFEGRCRAVQSPQAGMTRMIRQRGGPVDPGIKALTVGSGPPPPVEDQGGHLPGTACIIHQTGGWEQVVPPALSLRTSRSGRRTLQEKYLESS